VEEVREKDPDFLEDGKELIENGTHRRLREDELRQLFARIQQISEL
jgi:hypothetical protein